MAPHSLRQPTPCQHIAHDVGTRHRSSQHATGHHRPAQLGVQRRHKAHHRQPLARIHQKTQGQRPWARCAQCGLQSLPQRFPQRGCHRLDRTRYPPQGQCCAHRQQRAHPPKSAPAQPRHHCSPQHQSQGRSCRHICTPQTQAALQCNRVMHMQAHAGGRGQHRPQKTDAFQRAGGQQTTGTLGQRPCHAAQPQQQQTPAHHPMRAPCVGQATHRHTRQHARKLQQRQQNPRLHQADAQFLAQQRNGHRQLSDMQGTHQPQGKHPPGRPRQAWHRGLGQRRHQNNFCPVRRWCSRTAKRSVMPAM